MTDRFHSLTVALDHDIREDDARALIDAICMLKHVAAVVPVVSDPASLMAEARARREIGAQLWDVLYPKKAQP